MKNKSIILFMACMLGVLFFASSNIKAESSYPYYIKVNRKQCVVTIYEKDESGDYTIPVKAMLCSPGWDTPIGTFKTPENYRWRLLMGDVWGQYSTRINKGVLFHSVWYYEKDPSTLSNYQFNKLGTICSHGCVRLSTVDAKWIYDNCPIGTTVTIYDSSNPGPLGKPEAIKVSTKTKMGYDPTDIWSQGNPYIKNKPKICGTENQTIEYGKKVQLLDGVTAFSSTNLDISKTIKINIVYQGKKVSEIDTTVPGKYYVTYTVKDSLRKKVKTEIVITVVDTEKPKIRGAYNIYLKEGEILDEETLLEDVTAYWHGEEMEAGSVKAILREEESTDDLESYKVIYKVKAPNGTTAKKTKRVYVDYQAPILTGVKDKEIAIDTVVNREFAMEEIEISDNFKEIPLENIKVTIEKISDTKYQVNYWVKDKCRNITRDKAIYTITNFLSFEGVEDKTITSSTFMNSYEALKGIKAYDNGSDITYRIKVDISELVDNAYTVTYTIEDTMGHEKSAVAIFTVE